MSSVKKPAFAGRSLRSQLRLAGQRAFAGRSLRSQLRLAGQRSLSAGRRRRPARDGKVTQAGPATAGSSPAAAETGGRWLLLVHQLPPRPPYLRAKIAQRLASVGALALKNSVYLLPARDDCREDFDWIAREAVEGGGQAWIGATEWLAGIDDEDARAGFRAQADRAYEQLLASCQEELAGRRPQDLAARGELAPLLASFRSRVERLRARDFFGAARGAEVAAWIDGLAAAAARKPRDAAARSGASVGELGGKVWVTRQGVFVDRIATAWLVRRFVDPQARFRFVPGHSAPARANEIRFDMAEAEVTHVGDRCTFEVLLDRLGLENPALERIAQLVHDIDLRDGRYGHPETAGVEQMLVGLVGLEPSDERRLEQGCEMFDRLYRAFGARPPAAASDLAARGAGARRRGRS